MKKLLITFCCIIGIAHMQAQEKPIFSPQLSPFQKIETRIGIVDVVLEYSRPSMRGRKVFGELEPYGKVWRTGANINTKLTVKDPVLIGETVLSPGTYTLFTKPDPEIWDIYFYTELDKYGVPDTFDEKKVVAHMRVPAVKLNRTIETLTLTFDDLTSNSAVLGISWEQTYVPILIKTPTDDVIQARLEAGTKSLITDYSLAGWNYFNFEKDTKKGLEAVNASIYLREQGKSFEEWLETIDLENWSLPWSYMVKSEMHADLGQKEEAIRAAERSLKLAQLIKSKFYQEKNRENLAKWGVILD